MELALINNPSSPTPNHILEQEPELEQDSIPSPLLPDEASLTRTEQDNGPVHIRVVVQPEDVQVKRVGRASCIEPEIKLCVESETQYPIAVTINAYLKVLGKDDKHKFILLRKSDEILLSKNHKKEIIPMKLRFLKNIKVQVLKRNLGVARPEASVVFQAVTRLNEVQASTSTTNFAIISDPRYLDEVKKRRACERTDGHESSPLLEYHPHPHVHHPRHHLPPIDTNSGDSSDEAYVPPNRRSHLHPAKRRRMNVKVEELDSPSPSPMALSPLHRVPEVTSWKPSSFMPTHFSSFQALKDTADEELLGSGTDDEEIRLIELVESLKHKGCNFRILPPETHA